MVALQIQHVWKKFLPFEQKTLGTTLKSWLLHDAWRKSHGVAPHGRPAIRWALQDIDFTLQRGETIGIVGSNGSGKSTLLKLIAQILRPTRGCIQHQGRIAALIELGAGFHPELTGRENALINSVILGLSKQQAKANLESIMAFADIGQAMDNPVRTYSSGMQARLGFAVAMHVQPDILLVDEILSVGDTAFAHKCEQALHNMRQNGTSIILVSHDLQTVEKWSDQVLWIDQGLMRAFGPPQPTIARYVQSMFPQTRQPAQATA